MRLGLLKVSFFLSGCRSLKEKRQRLGGLKDRFGRKPEISVAEVDLNDDHQRSAWCFAAISSSGKVVDAVLTQIERDLAATVDAQIIAVEREWLC